MITNTYRFLGTTPADVHGYPTLRRVGESVQLPTELYEDAAIRGNMALLPDADFQQIGFTDEELARPDPSNAGFLGKLRLGWLRLHELRSQAATTTTEEETA
jgi:hypothetical protein